MQNVSSTTENKWIDLSQHADMPKDLTESTDSFGKTNKTPVEEPVETTDASVQTTPVEQVETSDASVQTTPEDQVETNDVVDGVRNEIVTDLPSDNTQSEDEDDEDDEDDEEDEEDEEEDEDDENDEPVPEKEDEEYSEDEESDHESLEDLPLNSMVVVVYDREYQEAEPSSKYIFTGKVHSKDPSKTWVKIDFGEDEGMHNFRKRFSFDFSKHSYVDLFGWVVRIHSIDFDYEKLRLVDKTANKTDEELRIIPQAVQVPTVAAIGYLLFIALITPMMRAVCH